MKHIKYKKLFESFEKDKRLFRDMFLELDDIGFTTTIHEDSYVPILHSLSKGKTYGVDEWEVEKRGPVIWVRIMYRYGKDDQRGTSWYDPFNIDMIMERLLFASTYCEEFGYRFNYAYISYMVNKMLYSRFSNDIDAIDEYFKGRKIEYISLSFVKI